MKQAGDTLQKSMKNNLEWNKMIYFQDWKGRETRKQVITLMKLGANNV